MLLNIFIGLILILTVISLIVSLLIGTSVISFFFVKVPFAPTQKKYVQTIIDHLNLRPGQIFYDLGCGDGRFLIEAAGRGAKAIGFEVSPWAYTRAKFNFWRHKNIARLVFKNFYYQDISDADAVFCFLLDSVMAKVEAKLKKELKPGAIVACYGFPLPTWPAEEIVYLNPATKKSGKLYLYKK